MHLECANNNCSRLRGRRNRNTTEAVRLLHMYTLVNFPCDRVFFFSLRNMSMRRRYIYDICTIILNKTHTRTAHSTPRADTTI